MRKIQIKEIFNSNQENIKLSNYDFINYLDTSSITMNHVDNIQKLSVGKDTIPSRAKRVIKKDTIVYSSVRPNLKHYGIIRNPLNNMVVSTGFITLDIKDKTKNDANYMYYNLTQDKYTDYLYTIACNNVSSYPSINPSDIEDMEIEIETDINKQKEIAKLFVDIDKKIELNNKINLELENLAKTLYEYWFVQFNFPDEFGRPYKSSGGEMVYSNELKREIPLDWEIGNLYTIADYYNGLACQKFRPIDNEQSLPVVKIGEMHNGINVDTELVKANIPAKNIIDSGDILFSWSATLEVMLWTGNEAGLNQHIFKVVPKSFYSKEYVYQQLSSYVINFVRIAEARKTTMGHITTDHLKQSKITLPPKEIIEKYSHSIEFVYKKMIECKKENLYLIKLRDFLLPMLMNGQVIIQQ